jgi:8-oxo-dGTP diphosphatase
VIEVVGAVIVRDGLVLCVQRGPDGSLPGQWEFPGGKVELGEEAAAALAREIHEELLCHVEVGDKVTTTAHDYDFGTVNLTTYYCELISGTPTLTEHSQLRWLPGTDLASLDWAPADVPAVKQIVRDLSATATKG